MVDIHLYGSLRRLAIDPRPDRDSVVRLEPELGETVATILERLGVQPAEVSHVFLNGALLSTDNAMAKWLDYQRVYAGTTDQVGGLGTSVRCGDRLGLFARDMALLVV
jgi:hypothetical protein